MSRDISQVFANAMMQANTDEILLYLITVEHSSFPSTLRYVRHHTSVTSGGNTFQAAGFDISLPEDDSERVGVLRILFDNTDRSIVDQLEEISGPAPTLKLELALEDSPGVAGSTELVFEGAWRSMNYSLRSVEVDVELLPDISGKIYPSHRYIQYIRRHQLL